MSWPIVTCLLSFICRPIARFCPKPACAVLGRSPTRTANAFISHTPLPVLGYVLYMRYHQRDLRYDWRHPCPVWLTTNPNPASCQVLHAQRCDRIGGWSDTGTSQPELPGLNPNPMPEPKRKQSSVGCHSKSHQLPDMVLTVWLSQIYKLGLFSIFDQLNATLTSLPQPFIDITSQASLAPVAISPKLLPFAFLLPRYCPVPWATHWHCPMWYPPLPLRPVLH